jgi:hypothetical protein
MQATEVVKKKRNVPYQFSQHGNGPVRTKYAFEGMENIKTNFPLQLIYLLRCHVLMSNANNI